jgi:DNA gyrase subunit B
MPAEDLKATTLDPLRRRALKVVIDRDLETDRVLNELMGKDPAPRFRYIMEHAPRADAAVLDV